MVFARSRQGNVSDNRRVYFDVLFLRNDKRNAVMKYAPTINVRDMGGLRGGVYEY